MAEANKIFLGNHRVFISALIYLEEKKNGNTITQRLMSNVTGISQKSISQRCKSIRDSEHSGIAFMWLYHMWEYIREKQDFYMSVMSKPYACLLSLCSNSN